jgi:AcrR family transcriptional regulator
VAAILEATGRLLRDGGEKALSMRKVAELTGVSMGTLYQYFAKREALLAAWEEQEFARILEEIGRVLAELVATQPPLEVALFTIANRGMIAMHAHLSLYDPGDGESYLSRAITRRLQLASAGEAFEQAFGFIVDRHRLRSLDAQLTVWLWVRAVVFFARVLAVNRASPEEQRRVRRQVALAFVHALVKDADEAILPEA